MIRYTANIKESERRKKISQTNIRLGRKPPSNLGKHHSCETIEKIRVKNTRHGMRSTRFYAIWTAMLSRCRNPKNIKYRRYGGRGIICLWENFDLFFLDMFESYQLHCNQLGEKNTQIDRINNDGNYCVENCKWSTPKEQANNRSNSKKHGNSK